MTKILIVEDEILIAQDIEDTLQSLGYEVAGVVTSGEKAVEFAAHLKLDAVLMDIHLCDEMDGIQAADIIYSNYRIPVIFLSAYSDDSLLERASRVGSFGYLLKPFDDRELKAVIEMASYKSWLDEERLLVQKNALMSQKYESLHTLAGGVAHNFNNILFAVQGNIELALDISTTEKEKDYFIKEAKKNVSRAVRLSHKMLTYVGINAEKNKLLNLGEVIDEVVDIIRLTLDKNIRLERKKSKEPVFIRSTDSLLGQVISNLVMNSTEAIGDKKGTITLETGSMYCDSRYFSSALYDLRIKEMMPGEYAFIRVCDTGRGIDHDIINRIFDPFFSTRFTGRGLGLPAALGAVQTCHGTILIEESSSHGTVMTVYFPVADAFVTK